MANILQQFKDHFPEIFPKNLENDRYSQYAILHYFGTWCADHLEDNTCTAVLHIVNKAYQRKDLFTCNAIENEFFPALIGHLEVSDAMKHLQRIPENLWTVYIKVLIETQKIRQQ